MDEDWEVDRKDRQISYQTSYRCVRRADNETIVARSPVNIYEVMKYWYKVQKTHIHVTLNLYHGRSWHLFNEDCPVTIEHFIGSNKEKQIYYKTTHDVSSELNLFKDSISFSKLTEIVEKLRLYVFEYKLNIDNTLIERAVVEGAILTGRSDINPKAYWYNEITWITYKSHQSTGSLPNYGNQARYRLRELFWKYFGFTRIHL